MEKEVRIKKIYKDGTRKFVPGKKCDTYSEFVETVNDSVLDA